MTWEQTRKITEQQAALKRSERTIQKLQNELISLSEVARTAISQIDTGYPHSAANRLRQALSTEEVSQMTVITDGLITEADRLALINAIVDPNNPANIHAVTKLALKLGVSREELAAAADNADQCAPGAEVTDQIKAALGECA